MDSSGDSAKSASGPNGSGGKGSRWASFSLKQLRAANEDDGSTGTGKRRGSASWSSTKQPAADPAAVAALMKAAKDNDVYAISEAITTRCSVNACDPMARTAVHEAAQAGNLEATKLLITRGADVNMKDSWEKTPLDNAMEAGHQGVQKLLIESGGKVGDAKKSVEKLFAAVSAGDIPLTQSLVRSGTAISSVDKDNRTALHHAVAKGDLALIDALIEEGAKLDAVDNYGLTPLGEASRHGSRTGENPIRDRLIAAGAETELSGEARKYSRQFIGFVGGCQALFILLFILTTKYDLSTTELPGSGDEMKKTYSMFMDVHVMIFAGFGFLMTFLRKYGHSSIGLNFLVATFVVQWHLICGGFFEQLFAGSDHEWHKTPISLGSLLLADFSAAAVLITMGALLGKVSPLQLMAVAFLEVIFFNINEQTLLKIGILDVGGSIIVHLFGAYFGLAASRVLSPKASIGNDNNSSVYNSDLFAMIGTIFLWVYWPSFVASPAGPHDQERAVIATTLSLTGSCVSAFVASLWLRGGKFSMVDIQNATLAGGVAIGSAANLAVMSPAEAVTIGVLGGLLSVTGYAKIQPKLEHYLGIHDTCGVNNLHGMPAILAGISSAIIIGYSGQESGPFGKRVDSPSNTFASDAAHDAVYGQHEERGTAQAGFQILCILVSFSIASLGGAISGFIVQKLTTIPDDEYLFLDKSSWEVPTQEMPFYFDERGEINRETLDIEAGSRPASRATDLPESPKPAASPAAGSSSSSLITNELLSMKLDLVLQQLPGAVAPKPAEPKVPAFTAAPRASAPPKKEAKTPVKQPSGLAAAVIAAAKAESSQEREPKEHKVDAQRVEKV